jgi:hypothetical protein
VRLGRPQQATLVLHMLNERAQRYEHAFAVSFNMRAHMALKWVLVLPFTLMAVLLLLLSRT